jgi:hypothetical protein
MFYLWLHRKVTLLATKSKSCSTSTTRRLMFLLLVVLKSSFSRSTLDIVSAGQKSAAFLSSFHNDENCDHEKDSMAL